MIYHGVMCKRFITVYMESKILSTFIFASVKFTGTREPVVVLGLSFKDNKNKKNSATSATINFTFQLMDFPPTCMIKTYINITHQGLCAIWQRDYNEDLSPSAQSVH